MKNKSTINHNLLKNTLATNFKAEVFACALIEKGVDKENIKIIRKGKSYRGVRKEVDKIIEEHTYKGDFYSIHIHRRDLYESLPKGIFHNTNSIAQKNKEKTTLLKIIKQGEKEEAYARLFFKPFEQFIDQAFIFTQLYERRLEKPFEYDDFVNLFVVHWPFLKGMPLDKAFFIIKFLSQGYRITDSEQIASILSFFLECEVTVENTFKHFRLRTSHHWKLGKEKLGRSSIIGNKLVEMLPVIIIRVNNLPWKYKNFIFQNSEERKQVNSLLEMLIPADAEIEFHINGNTKGGVFILSDTEKPAILGYSTILS